MKGISLPKACKHHLLQPRKGFMLIELAVACFVVGTCLLALLAVARSGQRAAAENEDETCATLFAQNTFATLRLFSDRLADENSGAWSDFWKDFEKGKPICQMPGFVDGLNFYDTEEQHAIFGDDQVHTNIWLSSDRDCKGLPDMAVQYRIHIEIPENFSDDTDAGTPGSKGKPPFNNVSVTLHVWNGLTRNHPQPYTFFKVFANPGRMP